MALFQSELPETGDTRQLLKDYPHTRDQVSKEIIATKLKAIRNKFRQAVDSKKRSGHGRVIYCYFDLCEKIWGGSPATELNESGVETAEVPESLDDEEDQEESSNSTGATPQEQQNGSNTTSTTQEQQNGSTITEATQEQQATPSNTRSTSTPTGSGATQEQTPVQVERKRREQPSNTLGSYRQQKLKKKVPMMRIAERELDIKEKMMDQFDRAMSKHRDTMKKLASNLN